MTPPFVPIRALLTLATGTAMVLSSGSHGARAADPEAGAAPQAEFATLAGLALRRASPNDTANPDGIGYDSAFQLGFQVRGYVQPWLSFALYHVRASHGVDLPRGAADINYQSIDIGSVITYSLGARLEPTYTITDHVRTWLSVGAGWGRMSLGKVHVTEADRSYNVRERTGVFVEVPVGIGAAYEFWPNRLTLQAEVDVAHLSKQSGKLYDPMPYVDSNGNLDSVGSFPSQTMAASFLLGVAVLL